MPLLTTPISHDRFALALPPLPLSALHAKAAELQNSIVHLEASNVELQAYADEGDKECAEAIEENKEVMVKMRERIELVKKEVENRGAVWGEVDDDAETETQDGVAGATEEDVQAAGTPNRGGRYTDGELARRLNERMQEDAGEENGVHL